MSHVKGLQCRECGSAYPVAAQHVCEFCFGPLEVVYDYDAIARRASAASRSPPARCRCGATPTCCPCSREPTSDQRVDLGAGFTPLVPAPRLGEALGLRDLWLKNDTRQPDELVQGPGRLRGAHGRQAARVHTAACASTGNLANSVAAHAATPAWPRTSSSPPTSRRQDLASAVYAPNLVAVKGTYDDVNRLCAEVAGEHGWAFVNVNVRPYYAEGSKTIGFEIAEQLGWQLPDHVVAPMASGSMLVKIDKAFTELVKVGLVEERPWRISGAQATGCSPIATAFKDGTGFVPRQARHHREVAGDRRPRRRLLRDRRRRAHRRVDGGR
jgi:threonine synthase